MKNSLLILVAILMMGCATRRDKSIAYMNDNPQDLSALCALHFKPIIEYKPGVTIHKTDTQYVEGDPIPCPPNEKGEVVYVKGRDKIVKDTIWRTDTIFQNDPYREADLAFKLRKAEDAGIGKDEQIKTLRSQRNKSLWANGILVVLAIGGVVLKRYLP